MTPPSPYQRLLRWVGAASNDDPERMGSFLAGLTLGMALMDDDAALAARVQAICEAADRWPTLVERHATVAGLREALP